MLSSRYAKEYRMDTETTGSGKVKRKMVYTGPLFEWDMPIEVLKRTKMECLLIMILSAGLFIGSLLFHSDVSRVWYVILPYAFFLPVLLFLLGACWNLFFAKQPMNRETKDKTYVRWKSSCVAGTVLCLITGIMAGIAMVLQHFTKTGDILLLTSDVFLCGLMLYGGKVGKCLRVEEKTNPTAEEWKNK